MPFLEGGPVLERDYQAELIHEIQRRYPNAVVLKNDTSYMQGIPDLLILNDDRWAMLEVKLSRRSRHQPNQNYYIDLFDAMSFGAFIYPENEQDVLDDLQRAFPTRRAARISQR